MVCTIWYTNYETNTAGHLPTLGWSRSHFRGTLTKNLHVQTSNTPQQEKQTAACEELRLSQGTNWTCSHVWIFHSLFNACSGSEIQSAARDGEIHTCDMGNSLAEMTVLENIQLWIRNQGFGGAYTVRNYRGIYKIKDIVNRFLIKNKTYYFKWSISNIIKKQIFNK